MAESCVSSPTLTTTQVITTNVPVTLIEDITTSLPALITTYTLTPSCSQVGRTCVAAPTTVTSTIPGAIVTTGITSTTTTTSELTLTTTLFGSSCSGTVTDTNTGTGTGIGTGTSTGSRSRTPGSATGTTTSRSETTSTFISTQSDGRVVTSLVTITAAPVGVNDDGATGTTGGNLKLGPIIGGVVGGVVVLIVVTLVTWYYLKKRATTKELDLLFDGDIKIKPHVEHGNHGPLEKVTKFETKIPQLEPQHQHQPTRQSYHDQYQQQQQQTGQVPQQQQERPEDYDDPRNEKKRLRKMYESTMTIANGIGNEINDAGPSRYNNSSSPPPSTSPNPNYPHQALPSVPTNAYYNPGSSSSNANVGHFVSGSIGHHHGHVPPVGYPYNQSTGHESSVPVDPRLSQYGSVSSPGSSRPTSIENLNGRQDQHTHAGYYQSTRVMYPNNPQVQIPGPPVVKVRQASGVGRSSAPRSEEHGQGYHLDGAQYQGGSSSTEPPPPAYMG